VDLDYPDNSRQLRRRRPHPPLDVEAVSAPSRGSPRNQSGDLFRFALVTDSHLWQNTSGRSSFQARSDAAAIRDGLLVSSSPIVYATLLAELSKFAARGGDFAVHAGDAVCGGASFHSPANDYDVSLRRLASAERAAVGSWPIHHVAGNHDLHPEMGGLDSWHRTLGSPRASAPGKEIVAYRALRRAGWRLLLLDTASDVGMDTDGHGSVDDEQLGWLESQLVESAAMNEQVILIAHQLFVRPFDASGSPASWLQLPDDMVENADQVLAILRRFSHVKLSLHGHVHANSLTSRAGIAFVSTASANEYPMQWREVVVRVCQIELRMHSLVLPQLMEKSARREAGRGPGRNEAKRGGALDTNVIIRTCPRA